ncbi:MAG: RNA polymerase-associated protein RapA [Spongiibacteraceae bacterium]|nr:RNA polymerase-associated protein RapA [Spongiibacteraceae bacterium]
MSIPLFVPGQRWVSNTESELGLGIVMEITSRRVEISFPASAERRTYAVDNAPLSRVRYEVGQQVSTNDEQLLTITEVIEERGCLTYSALDSGGDSLKILEIELNSFVQFSKPQDRLFAGQIDKNRAFALRCETLEHIRHQQQSPVRGLLGPRVQLLPHQLYIASETAARFAPRVLLADEVGLGKTIEAGLILHQQLITGNASRAMIVVPDSLLHQWLVEMLRRFNLFFTILDEDRCEALEESDDTNPFESTQLVLCTLSFFTNNKKRLEQATAAQWDLLIVDEAHHLQWSETHSSVEYNCIEALARGARGLLLLTATPEQLGIESHFARLRLLDPDRYYDLAQYCEQEKNHQPVNHLVQQLLADTAWQDLREQPSLLEQLESYLGREALVILRQLIDSGDEQAEDAFTQAIAGVIRDLLDRHGTGRVLFRNTRSSMSGFPERKLHTYPLSTPPLCEKPSDQVPLDELLAPELLLGEQWISTDSRVPWLVDWLKTHRGDKVLIICARALTALALEEHLRLRQGVRSAVFHENLSLLERDRAAAYFAEFEDGAQILVCSEIGSEGRNFQFAHHLVLFDLPLNPDLLEQRIGRLDRIGLRQTINIHVPYYTDGAQRRLLRWYHEGLNAFERTFAAGQVLFEMFSETLLRCLAEQSDEGVFEQLIVQTAEKAQQTLEALQQGRDRLLELNSCNHERADQIVTHMVEEERRQELSSYMEQVFDLFGVEQEHHSAVSVVLRPGDHMLCHSFPGLPEDGLTATFQRDLALSREDIHFLTWEHPMVSGAFDMVLGGELGNTAFCTLKLPPLKPGTLLLEAVFIVHCSAPENLQIHRYLPLTTIRIVIDSNNTNLSKVLTPSRMNTLCEKVPKRSSQDLVRHARSQITKMISQAETLAGERKVGVIEQASTLMAEMQNGELARLKALAAVNPNIRQDEIAYLQANLDNSQGYLQGAQLKLDALRVGLVRE